MSQAQFWIFPLLFLSCTCKVLMLTVLSSFYTEETEILRDEVKSRFKSYLFGSDVAVDCKNATSLCTIFYQERKTTP